VSCPTPNVTGCSQAGNRSSYVCPLPPWTAAVKGERKMFREGPGGGDGLHVAWTFKTAYACVMKA
jgi:hypothetical protein